MKQRTIFTSATLYDGRNAKQKGMTVVVEGGRIAAVGADGAGYGDGLRIDLDGKSIMPGMTVGHWHGEFVNIGPPLFASGRAGTFIGTEQPPAILALQAASALRSALLSGVLRVISAACSNNLDGQMKMALESGLIEGADIVPCSRHILGTADQEDRGKWWQAGAAMPDGLRRVGGNVFADGDDAITRAVRQEILFGADIVKTYIDGGHGLDWTASYRSNSASGLRALVDAAHERDKRVRAHVTNKESILACIGAGVDILDHCDYLDEECIEAMARHGTFFVPSPLFGKLASSVARGERPDPANPADRTWLNLLEMLPKANRAGVRIVPGDDYGAQGMLHAPGVYGRELDSYVNDFGIPATDVIGWATANGAAMAQAGADTGTIEAGKAADLLVLDGDPGEAIGMLTDPERFLKLIVQRGRIVKNALDATLG